MEVNNRNQLPKKTFNVETHPCQYCEKSCIGKQCKDCHLKMVAKSKSKCQDCEQIFFATRKDGTLRDRCKECQNKKNKEFMAMCPGCNVYYHAILKDGRIFDKCFDCYKSGSKLCITKCGKYTINGYDLCVACHKDSIKTGTCTKCSNDTVNGFSLCINCHKMSFENKPFRRYDDTETYNKKREYNTGY